MNNNLKSTNNKENKPNNNKLSAINQLVSRFRTTNFLDARKQVSEEEHKKNIENLLKNLDSNARTNCLNLINKLEKTYNKKFVPLKEIYSKEELEELEKVKAFEGEPKRNEDYFYWKNFKLPVNSFFDSTFYYKHGLNKLKTLNNMDKDAVIIDAGAYICDSALIFREFCQNKIIAFEPIKSIYEMGLKTIELNHLQNIQYENLALGDKNETIRLQVEDPQRNAGGSKIVQQNEKLIKSENYVDGKSVTLDSYVKEHNLKVGLIKTDVEGFEQQLLNGAKQTICEQKPILLISIYHSYNDFYKIKPMIESWNLGYKFDFFQGVQKLGSIEIETLLVCEQE